MPQQPTDAQPPGRDRGRRRPEHQAAQVILRMSPEARAALHELAELAGAPSTSQYVLGLIARDAAARSASRAAAAVAAMVATTHKAEEPGPGNGPDSYAEAGRVVAATAS